MVDYGVSFSAKQCRNFGISTEKCLVWLLKDCGFRRFRLMSYWDETEPAPGQPDFKELDKQLELIRKYKGTVTLCLGARQPRWPENHWPDWAWQLTKPQRTEALLKFIETVVRRYQSNGAIVSYQLENEALLKSFGERAEIDRQRLRQEFNLIKRLDPTRPVIMSTSTPWGMPCRRPIPDIVGFSYYQTYFNPSKQRYATAFHKLWLDRMRSFLIKIMLRRPSFIHELQLEPWGPQAIWEMTMKEQLKSMGLAQIRHNIAHARKSGLSPVDMWGSEWWYWCAKKQGNPKIIDTVLQEISK